ncbi:MAG: glutathione peroxidase [Flavobacteriales bacterium]|nr:glutathione peroxidase [Flavobacteriales bacterium]
MGFHDLKAISAQGDTVRMDRFRGMKVLVVNTASECGYTPQYQQLQELYSTYKDRGLVVLAFPSNDFGGQEPGSNEEVVAFCESRYAVTFPIMGKVHVTGTRQDPVFRWLTSREENGKLEVEMDWNFRKFLIDEEGRLVTTFAPATSPLDPAILDHLGPAE